MKDIHIQIPISLLLRILKELENFYTKRSPEDPTLMEDLDKLLSRIDR